MRQRQCPCFLCSLTMALGSLSPRGSCVFRPGVLSMLTLPQAAEPASGSMRLPASRPCRGGFKWAFSLILAGSREWWIKGGLNLKLGRVPGGVHALAAALATKTRGLTSNLQPKWGWSWWCGTNLNSSTSMWPIYSRTRGRLDRR